ncbi:MAG: FtsX-like permease family protein [Nitrospirae bacterium]|nr:FtsX-like permease family protein [Nitrospirota bacterium]
MSVPYSLSLALQSLFKEKWINLLSILTIASALLIISISVLTVYNIDAATKKLPERFSLILYLDDDLPKEGLEHTLQSLRKNTSITSVRYIPKEDALREMKAMLKNSHYVFEGLEENPLPDSLEVKVRKEAVGPEAIKGLAEYARKIKGVKEVDYGENYVSTLHYLKVGVKTAGMVFIGLISTGIIFVCYSTVKILFYRRNEEIETFKLLGATKGFIRTPFLIEGAVIGAAGGLAGLLGILAFYYIVLQKLSTDLPVFKAILLPLNLFLPLPVAGMILGIAGAAIALGRLKY